MQLASDIFQVLGQYGLQQHEFNGVADGVGVVDVEWKTYFIFFTGLTV